MLVAGDSVERVMMREGSQVRDDACQALVLLVRGRAKYLEVFPEHESRVMARVVVNPGILRLFVVFVSPLRFSASIRRDCCFREDAVGGQFVRRYPQGNLPSMYLLEQMLGVRGLLFRRPRNT